MADTDSTLLEGSFPDGFMWATATAAYQIEGGWDADGKGENIWDRFCHEPSHIINGDTGDIACDSYHKYKEDIQLIKDLGCSHYRFSLSWARLLPDGTPGTVNEAGVRYYNQLIDGLLAAGVQPIVTLYHWDLPQALQDRGGWEHEDSIGWFTDYARLSYEKFGDRVKWWVTFNEPSVVVEFGYGAGIFAPGIKDPYGKVFAVTKNLVRAHVRAFNVYDQCFREKQKGQVGIAVTMDGVWPLDPSDPTHVHAAELAMKIRPGIYLDPLFGDGDFPKELLDLSAKVADIVGDSVNPLTGFTTAEKAENKGACDFIGVNNYTSRKVSQGPLGEPLKDVFNFSDIFGIQTHTDPTWKRAGVSWLYETPQGLRMILKWLKQTYNNAPLFVMENGTTDGNASQLDDQHRINYLTAYINEVLKAIRLDDCNVLGYTVWSLMDNFEWTDGYTQNFGLHHVDFTNPHRTRTPKASATFYKELIVKNGFSK